MSQNPEQILHIGDPTHRASAPYNFVPLPEQVVTVVSQEELLKAQGEEADRLIDERLPDHDRFLPGRKSGYFEVKLDTRSPLYIRGPLSTNEKAPHSDRTEFEQAEWEKEGHTSSDFHQAMKNKPDFFYTSEPNRPVIPGSSLRGMLRNIFEVITWSKVQWVTEKRLFFRSVENPTYSQRMVNIVPNVIRKGHNAPLFLPKVKSGFFHIKGQNSFSIEECDLGRVDDTALVHAFRPAHPGLTSPSGLYESGGGHVGAENNPMRTPKWDFQQAKLWVTLDPEDEHFFVAQPRTHGNGYRHRDLFLRFRCVSAINTQEDNSKTEATLVLTGPMQFKHMAFVFVKKNNPQNYDLPNDNDDPNLNLVDRFQDEDQLSKWQTMAFPDGEPAGAKRGRNGCLRDGEPIFFLTDQNGTGKQVIFFGRAQMFRLPYLNRPIDLVPPALRRPGDIDLAEAVFGFVRSNQDLKALDALKRHDFMQGCKKRGYAGRVFITQANLDEGQTDYFEDVVDPKILASPKPTSFQHYLVQQSTDRHHLGQYDPGQGQAATVLRGHKFYWFKGNVPLVNIHEDSPDWIDQATGKVNASSSQHTQFKAVKAKTKFTFRVYFKNLSDVELGALHWALELPGGEHCHALGMGKPFGMGAVKLSPILHLTDRNARYTKLFNDDSRWETGELGQKDNYFLPYISFIENQVGKDKYNYRISRLLKLLEWPYENADFSEKRNMTDLNDFRSRKVLPDVLDFGPAQPDAARPGPVHQPVNPQPFNQPAAQTIPTVLAAGEVVFMKVVELKPNGDGYFSCSKFPPNYEGRILKANFKGHQLTDKQKRKIKNVKARVVSIDKDHRVVECELIIPEE